MKKQKHICVIFTGGTIGSAALNGAVGLDGGSGSALLGGYRRRFGDAIIFDELRPVAMLSENVLPADLAKIVAALRGVDFAAYDGVIVTHGTDTLNFTANYCGLLFCDAPVPVVFVSALFPLSDPRSNGEANFAAAVTLIESADYGGVFVAFKNPGEACKIHLASRLVSASQLVGAYDSLLGVHFGLITNDKFVRNDDPRNPTEIQLKHERRVPAAAGLCTEVVTIRARALLDFSYYRFDAVKPRAVLVELYHSGTVCTQGKRESFLKFRDYCAELGIPTIIAPVGSEANVYDSAKDLANGSSIVAYDTSFEMTTVKVMCALHSGLELQTALNNDIYYEKVLPQRSR